MTQRLKTELRQESGGVLQNRLRLRMEEPENQNKGIGDWNQTCQTGAEIRFREFRQSYLKNQREFRLGIRGNSIRNERELCQVSESELRGISVQNQSEFCQESKGILSGIRTICVRNQREFCQEFERILL